MSEEKTPGITIVPEKTFDLLTNDMAPEPSASSDRLSDRAAKAAAKQVNDDPSAKSAGYNNKDSGGKTATAEESAPTKEAAAEPEKEEKEHKEAKPDNTPPEEKRYITKAKNEIRQLKEMIEARDEQLRQTLALAEKFIPKPTKDKPEPKLEQFGSHDEYAEAKAEWLADLRVEATERQRQEDTAIKEQNRIAKAHNKRLEDAEERYPGIVELSSAKYPIAPPINDAMGAAILTSDLGPDIIHWLDENRDEAERIYKLAPARAAAEIGKIEAKVSAPVEKKASKAPVPIEPLGANNSVKKDILNGPSDAYWADYERRRKEQVASLKTVIVR